MLQLLRMLSTGSAGLDSQHSFYWRLGEVRRLRPNLDSNRFRNGVECLVKCIRYTDLVNNALRRSNVRIVATMSAR